MTRTRVIATPGLSIFTNAWTAGESAAATIRALSIGAFCHRPAGPSSRRREKRSAAEYSGGWAYAPREEADMPVRIEKQGPVTTVILDRPEVRNAVDRLAAQALADAFRAFDADPEARVAVLWGAGGTFCAGADLKAIAAGEPNRVAPEGDGPMGPTRMVLDKPVVA